MLAIVIPYYKLKFFEETLISLSNQTNKNFRVYIGNDASPDDPIDLIKSFQEKFTIIYKRFEENLGGTSLTGQWDRCIEMVQEEKWIMILGDDDVLESSIVNAFYQHLAVFEEKSKVVRFASKIITEESKIISNVFEHPVWEKAGDAYFRKYRGLTRSSLSEYIFEKAIYMKIGFFSFPLAWHSDDMAWLEFSGNTPIYSINEAVVFVRNSSISISGKTDNEDSKHLATLNFSKHIISKRLSFFSKDQRLEIMRTYENLIEKKRNVQFKEWAFLFYFYLKNYEEKSLKKLFKRFIKGKLEF